jgi:hypothetical protein
MIRERYSAVVFALLTVAVGKLRNPVCFAINLQLYQPIFFHKPGSLRLAK